MMFHSKKQGGFSLVELMVVLAIMGAVMGLTGGLVINVVAKQEKQVEIEKVKQLFKQLSYKAYYSGNEIKVKLAKNEISLEIQDEIEIIPFKQLTFVANEHLVSTNGIFSANYIALISNDHIQNISISSLYERHEKL